MNKNQATQLRWLWKWRHKHDDDPDLQSQITIIRQTVEGQSDLGAGTGAFVHLLATTQEIPAGGSPVTWDPLYPTFTPLEFAVTPPVTSVEIPKPGYYDVEVELEWASWLDGGSVQIFINDQQVWPPSNPGVWLASNGRTFVDVAKGIPCFAGDILEIRVDHGSEDPQELVRGVLVVELVDRDQLRIPEPPPDPGAQDLFIFTESGTFDWVAAGSPSTLADVWIFAGGGSGAKGGAPNGWRGGGGGAGGLLHLEDYAVSGDVAVVVGNGGPAVVAAPSDIARGSKGQSSSFDGQVAEGGGRGGVGVTDGASVGAMDGGCGGGGTTAGAVTSGTPGDGSQGGDGGPAPSAQDHSGGGGGVAPEHGESGADGGRGGDGIDLSSIVGTDYGEAGWFGGGGSGHGVSNGGDGGGQGGGGDPGVDGLENSGGGGGGGLDRGGAGGKGIVIVKVT